MSFVFSLSFLFVCEFHWGGGGVIYHRSKERTLCGHGLWMNGWGRGHLALVFVCFRAGGGMLAWVLGFGVLVFFK